MRLVLCVALVLGGCKKEADEPVVQDTDVPASSIISLSTWSDRTDADGLISVAIEVEEGTTSFLLTGSSKKNVGVETLINPDGDEILKWRDWYNSDEALTEALYGYSATTAFNWPIREVDGPLTPGTWTVALSTTSSTGNYAQGNIDFSLHTKADPTWTDGVVHARIVYADGVDSDDGIVAATEDAVVRWQEIWAQYGLALVARYESSTLDPQLGFAWSGDDSVETVAAESALGEVVMVIGEQIDQDFDTYGVAGGIPGTLTASPLTYVVISWLNHAGFDGQFTKAEKRMYGETMAHEVGHYMGLFHPVEDGYDSWDALDDTPRCDRWSSCEDEMASNLMYPYSVCDGADCVAADVLTGDQQAVVHRYTGVQ